MENPVKRIRMENNMTQAVVASRANVTTQVITRLEAGTLTEIPTTILRDLAFISGQSTLSIVSEYEEWIDEELINVRLPNEVEKGILYQEDFICWVDAICDFNDVPRTIHSLAGLLKIHPYVLDKWYKGKMQNCPQQLIERIKQIRRLQGGKYPR